MRPVAERLSGGVATAAEGQWSAGGERVLPPFVVGHAEAEAEIATVGGEFHDQRAIDPAADRHASGWERPLRGAGSFAVAHNDGGGWGSRST
ncbi:MAG: hypothetical protein RLZZ326_837, partial [Planctomycetota bacterium]